MISNLGPCIKDLYMITEPLGLNLLLYGSLHALSRHVVKQLVNTTVNIQQWLCLQHQCPTHCFDKQYET